MSAPILNTPSVAALDERSRDILRRVVDAFVATGEPIGSKPTVGRAQPFVVYGLPAQ